MPADRIAELRALIEAEQAAYEASADDPHDQHLWRAHEKAEEDLQDAVTSVLPALLDCAEACKTMIEWDAREQDHAVDFYARMALCQDAFDKARAALAKLEGRE